MNYVVKYRSRTEIVSNMLEAANGGAIKTKIMYQGYLSYAQLKEYLTILVDNGLLEYIQGEGKFYTTSKGIKFLGVYTQLDLLVHSASMAKDRE